MAKKTNFTNHSIGEDLAAALSPSKREELRSLRFNAASQGSKNQNVKARASTLRKEIARALDRKLYAR